MLPLSTFLSGRRVVAALLALSSTASLLPAGERRLTLTAFDESAVERARLRAARRLEDPECQKVLLDFKDGEGRTLQDKLSTTFGVAPTEYLAMIPFLDGSSQKLCRWSKVDLVTTPGIPRVYVCPQFAMTEVHDPWLAEVIVIHEMLHTLGLRENPPSSTEITQRVKGRCS